MDEKIQERLLRNVDGTYVDEEVSLKDKVLIETKKIWVVAGPAIFTRFSTYGINLISQGFVGHIGPTELAAYSLVFPVLLRFANGILLGMASALETLCGQTYGAKEYPMMGVYLQRSWIVMFISSVFLLPLFIFTAPLLKALGQEEHIAEVAGIISLWIIPVMFAFIVAYSCQMFLQAQSKNMIISYLAATSVSIHLFLSWLLTVKYKFGLTGAMLSAVMAYWIPNLGQLLFIMCGGCNETWKGFSILALKDLWPVFKLSLSSGVMICVELWYNTILILLTGNMKNAEVSIDALAVCINISGLEMMISLGFLAAARHHLLRYSFTSINFTFLSFESTCKPVPFGCKIFSVRVSNELGRGSSKAAKFSITVIVLMSFIIGLVLFVFFLLLRGRIAYIFTNSPEVASVVADLSPLLAFSILLNSVQPVLSGVAVGAGRQGIVAYVNVSCYYLVGIPVGVLLGYVAHLGVKGVWMGMLLGTFVQMIVLILITCRTDWDKQVTIAQNRVNKWTMAEAKESMPESEAA